MWWKHFPDYQPWKNAKHMLRKWTCHPFFWNTKVTFLIISICVRNNFFVWLVLDTFKDLICSYWWWQLHWWPPRGGMSLHPGGMSWCLRSNVLGGWESEIWYKREEMESWKHTIGMREWIRCRKTILSGRMLWIFSQEEMGTMQPGSLLVWHQKDYSAVDNRFGH